MGSRDVYRKEIMNHASYVVELNSINDQIPLSTTSCEMRYQLSKRREALQLRLHIVNQWLWLMSEKERHIVYKHLVQRLSWHKIADIYAQESDNKGSIDTRSLQRIQARALDKVDLLMKEAKIMLDDDAL
jgi:hypothetical protein